MQIYNTLGQRVRTLVDEVQARGKHQVSWDARDQGGVPVAAGVYLSRLQYPGGVQTQRLLFLMITGTAFHPIRRESELSWGSTKETDHGVSTSRPMECLNPFKRPG